MKKTLFAIAGTFSLVIGAALPAVGQSSIQVPLKATYGSPAANWESEALPIGNGHMGAMIFGGVSNDVIQVNEKTLWSGGPGEDADYDGGHLHTPAEVHEALQGFRKELQRRVSAFDNSRYESTRNVDDARDYDDGGFYDPKWEQQLYVNRMLGTKEHFGSFQTLSDIHIDDAGFPTNMRENSSDSDEEALRYSDYVRALDIDHAVHTVEYTYNGTKFRREYFMSYPDNVMMVKLTADKPFSRKVSIVTQHSDYEMKAGVDRIVLTGWPTPVSGNRLRENDNWRDCLRFAQVLAVHSTDGKTRAEDNSLVIEDATEIVLVMSAATNYKQCFDDSFDYFSDEDPLDKASATVNAAKNKDYDALWDSHQADYCRLYDRNRISLAASVTAPDEFTDVMLADMSAGRSSDNVNRYLETLYYQYGRYLLISSSREGSLPANLQGVWGDRLSNAWNADYHTNINIQMNYWPAEPTNLAECHVPMVEFVRSLEPRGSITARHYHCRPDGGDVRGWTAYHEVNVWGNTAPAQNGTHSIFPEGGIWMCQDIWEYYRFNQDVDFLRKYFPTMKNAALFWVDNLWTDERDGTLVANPSLSPEHGAFSLGCTASQGIIYEIFDAVGKAADVLGLADDAEVREIAAAKVRLSMPKIGLGGQFMEWKDEVRKDLTGDGSWDMSQGRYVNTHRHTNHLFWLHPGSQVVPGRSDRENRYADAMKVTLYTRGDEGTGWSRAWKLNFWARLRDGEHAYRMIRGCMNLTAPGASAGGVYTNLFDAHPPFQIDGNFGFTAGVAEMLMQSQGDKIELLPAIPSAWNEGSFKGMRARGGFEVDAVWSDGRVSTATITSLAGKECTIKFPGASRASVSGAEKRVVNDDEISFPTSKGDVVTITVPPCR